VQVIDLGWSIENSALPVWRKRLVPQLLASDPPDLVARKLIAHAPQRMIWGTDWPHVMKKKPMANDGDMADLLERWVPDAALRKRILVDNPAALYGF
jgi:predicted TIM-barrel fold metal-dependent hydrolase